MTLGWWSNPLSFGCISFWMTLNMTKHDKTSISFLFPTFSKGPPEYVHIYILYMYIFDMHYWTWNII